MKEYTQIRYGNNRSGWKATGAFAVVVAQCFIWSSVHAQEPATPLGQTAGLTDLQQRAGDAVQTVCRGLANTDNPTLGIDETRADSAMQRELLDKCGEMVRTSVELTGTPTGEDGTSNGLGITSEQLGSALQNVTAEEIAAAGSLATESVSRQTNVIGRRLASLLSQVSSLQVSSANMRSSQALVFAGDMEQFRASGAGAAADEGAQANPLGFYVSGLGAFAEKSATDGEDGFESNSAGISVGMDYLITSQFLAGLNLGYSSSTTDFDNTDDVAGGDLDSDQTNISAYGMWFNDVGYVDLIAGFGSGSYDMSRRVVIGATEEAIDQDNTGANDTVFADTDSTAFRFGIGGGLEMRSGVLSFAPYSRLSYMSVDMDGYEETGDSALKLRVNSQSIDSLTGGFGFRLVGTYSGSKAIISPQFNVELVHEFMDDSRQIVSTYVHDPRSNPLIVVTDNPDRTYYTMGFGVSAVLASGTQLFSEVRSLMDLDDLNEISLTAGLRFEF